MKRKLLKQTQRLNIVMIPYFVPEPPGNIHSSGFSDFFLYAGRLDAPKGIVELIYLCKRGEFKLVVVGDGPLTDTVVALLRSNGLGDRITYLGYVDSQVLYPLLRDANALIIPSICGESSPQIAHEALSVGTPVIGSNNGGLPEIIEKIDKSLIFSSFDELNDIILGFSRNRYPSDEVRGVYDKYYSPRSYLESYKSLIDRSANVSLNSPESSVDRVTQEC
jgi:glycosyltransferase involved in cell wall biosynthesis